MAAPDSGVTWNESKPDNDSTANQIDDFNRHLSAAVRSRMAHEHVWPSAHTGTGSGGRHTFLTFQAQGAAPTMAGTTVGGLYVSTAPHSLIFEASKAGTALGIIVDTEGVLQIATGGTQGGVVIASSANTGGSVFLAASAPGLTLLCHTATGAPTWDKVGSAGIADSAIASVHLANVTTDFTVASGYVTLTPGLIMQWGQGGAAGSGIEAITFATSFANTCFQVVACAGATTGGTANIWTTAIAKTGFNLYHGANERPARYIALGH